MSSRFTKKSLLNTPGLSVNTPCFNYGHPGFVKAFDSGNGRELWRLDLPFQLNPAFRVYGTHHARITPDSKTAYISTYSLAEYPLGADPHTFLHAIDIDGSGGGEPPPPDPCDYDGRADRPTAARSCRG